MVFNHMIVNKTFPKLWLHQLLLASVVQKPVPELSHIKYGPTFVNTLNCKLLNCKQHEKIQVIRHVQLK